MFSPSGEYSESRPFKIFVSLLDKWEIGGPVTDALIYDVFKAVKSHVDSNPDGAEDVSATDLFEAHMGIDFLHFRLFQPLVLSTRRWNHK